MKQMNKNKWFLNGGRGSGRSFRLLCETYENKIANLKKENAELKKEVLEVRQHLDLTEGEWGKDLYKQIHFKTQLTKAKEIIKKFSEFVNNEVEYDPEHPQEHTDLWNKLCEEAGQFLSEVDK